VQALPVVNHIFTSSRYSHLTLLPSSHSASCREQHQADDQVGATGSVSTLDFIAES
jgi:hypothetical protein